MISQVFLQVSLAHHGALDWSFVLIAAFCIGASKAGIKGVSVLNVTLLAWVFGARASTGVLIPMLVVADIAAVMYYHRDADWPSLRKLLPWIFAGVLLAVWIGDSLSSTNFKHVIASIILITIALMLWQERNPQLKVPDTPWLAGLAGLSVGVFTMLGNLAGPLANVYFLAMRFRKSHFIGTTAWLFLIVNIFKLPFHIWVWETVRTDTLWVNLQLLPALFLGFWVGIRLTAYIKEKQYRRFILAMTALGALVILIR